MTFPAGTGSGRRPRRRRVEQLQPHDVEQVQEGVDGAPDGARDHEGAMACGALLVLLADPSLSLSRPSPSAQRWSLRLGLEALAAGRGKTGSRFGQDQLARRREEDL